MTTTNTTKIEKTDIEWLRGFCHEYTDDVVKLIQTYMKKARNEKNKKED